MKCVSNVTIFEGDDGSNGSAVEQEHRRKVEQPDNGTGAGGQTCTTSAVNGSVSVNDSTIGSGEQQSSEPGNQETRPVIAPIKRRKLSEEMAAVVEQHRAEIGLRKAGTYRAPGTAASAAAVAVVAVTATGVDSTAAVVSTGDNSLDEKLVQRVVKRGREIRNELGSSVPTEVGSVALQVKEGASPRRLVVGKRPVAVERPYSTTNSAAGIRSGIKATTCAVKSAPGSNTESGLNRPAI